MREPSYNTAICGTIPIKGYFINKIKPKIKYKTTFFQLPQVVVPFLFLSIGLLNIFADLHFIHWRFVKVSEKAIFFRKVLRIFRFRVFAFGFSQLHPFVFFLGYLYSIWA